jgi:hypothetical protein
MAKKKKKRGKRLKIALIGYGAISQMLFDVFKQKKPPIDIVGVLVRRGRAKATQKAVGRKVAVVEDLKACSSSSPTWWSRPPASRRCATGARPSSGRATT